LSALAVAHTAIHNDQFADSSRAKMFAAPPQRNTSRNDRSRPSGVDRSNPAMIGAGASMVLSNSPRPSSMATVASTSA
jgi:hypothetical protein